MRDTLAHRGPDGAGVHCCGAVGLGHRRLSIIDLTGGGQPLANEDQSVWVTFNGEIYNYRELTRRLTSFGHRFRTQSDAEVLVHGYEQYGVQLPCHLNGMFAFALHDIAHSRITLVRDHLGIKPLFYALTSEGLFFASEVKAILAAVNGTAEADPLALQEYLTFRHVAWDRTFFQGIRRLPPGHVAVWETGALSVQPYWSVARQQPATTPNLATAVEALDGHLERAVRSQLMSEVPLGTFCSGGIDSGLVTAYAARNTPGTLHTFSVGFDDHAWDETPLARETAARFGTEHHSTLARGTDLVDVLAQLIRYHDEPLSHPNSVPLYWLSRLARQHVTVVLTGEGADELLCGYPRYHVARLNAVAHYLPRWARVAGARLIRTAPGHRAAFLARLLPHAFEDAVLFNSAYLDPKLVAALTGNPLAEATAVRRALLRESMVPGDPIGSISRYELRTYLGCALERMDRMTMACGLEGRVPFLDVPLVEWAVALPSTLKIKGASAKRVVRQLAARLLSPRVVRGPKSGFGLPLAAWFRSSAYTSVLRRLQDARHPAASYFDRRVLDALVETHLAGRADHSEALWLLLNVYVWHEVHITGEATWLNDANRSLSC